MNKPVLKRKNKMRCNKRELLQYIADLEKYCQQLEKENKKYDDKTKNVLDLMGIIGMFGRYM